jgi:hypothetical protein
MAEAGQQAPKRTTLKGWFVLAILFGLLGIGFWGRATHDGLLQALGFLPLLFALLIFMIRSDRRAKRDPEYAARLAEIQQKNRFKKVSVWKNLVNRIGWISVALTLVVLDILRKAGWNFGRLSLEMQIVTIVVAATAAVFLINFASRVVRRPAR